jgi:hypothetical protein
MHDARDDDGGIIIARKARGRQQAPVVTYEYDVFDIFSIIMMMPMAQCELPPTAIITANCTIAITD